MSSDVYLFYFLLIQTDYGPYRYLSDKELGALMNVLCDIKVGSSMIQL